MSALIRVRILNIRSVVECRSEYILVKMRRVISPREAALQVIYQVTEQKAFASLALNEVLNSSKLESRDRNLATELAYSTIKAWNTIDWVLDLFVRGSIKKLPAWIRSILRLGASQLLYIERIPSRASIYETVELAKKYGHRGTVSLVNGVLRNIARNIDNLPYPDVNRDPVGYLSLRYYHPRWLVSKWLEQFGLKETEELLRINNEPAPMVIRTNTLKISVPSLIKRLQEENVTVRPVRFAPEGMEVEGLGTVNESSSFQEGLFYIQDEGSQVVSHALKPEPGSVVIDASAAPGGKTTHIAQLMGNKGTILSCDVHENRLKLIDENCRRLGVNCVKTKMVDARQLGNFFPEIADYLLIDAPCSGLGVLRRRPDARWHKEETQIEELSSLQLEIMLGAKQVLKPGGVMVYSTCSIAPEENQEVINKFLDTAEDFFLDSLEDFLPVIPEDLKPSAKQGWVQLLPQCHGTDGFFIARLKKKK
ncbi:MAG: rRNA (cytosine967-C5)-methyltransferase [Clostridia bacterium]|nr:rRNA (cytosine967-C5)-methyltransferase [Clostridia bacterium]